MMRSLTQSRASGIAMPTGLRPMLATLAPEIPVDAHNYGFEYKWDGVRAIVYWDGRHLRIESRNQIEMAHRYPELAGIGEALRRHTAILDGEIVALDARGRPSFELLQRRMHVEDRRAIPRLTTEVPACLLLFDVLYFDGRLITDWDYPRRREALERLRLDDAAWQTPPHHVGQGQEMLEAARRLGLEGIVAKRMDSIYELGRRSRNWLKIKIVARQEFVIGGWIPEGGQNRSRIGTLLMGYYDDGGHLHFAGGVGTGYDDRWHRLLTKELARRGRTKNPFEDMPRKPGAMYVRPDLVAEVEYRRWPAQGMLQQAAFKGLRTDKEPSKVMDERPRDENRRMKEEG